MLMPSVEKEINITGLEDTLEEDAVSEKWVGSFYGQI